MPRKLSEQYDNVAWFYEDIVSHLDTNDSIFLGGAVLSRDEKRKVQSKLQNLAQELRSDAIVLRANDR